jgi:hypothetical protein
MKLIGKYFSLLVLSLILLALGCEVIKEGMPISYAQKSNTFPSFNRLDREAEEIALNDFRSHWSQIDVSSSSKEKTDWFAFSLENDGYPYGYCKYHQISVGGYEVMSGEVSELQKRNKIEWRGTVIIKITAEREQNGLEMGETPKPMKMDFQPSLSIAYNLIKEKGKWSFTYAQGSALLGPLFRTNLTSFRTPEQEATRVRELLKTQQGGERQKSNREEVDVLKDMVYSAKQFPNTKDPDSTANKTIAFFKKFTDKELACLNNTATAGIYEEAKLPLPFGPNSGFKGAVWNTQKEGWDFGNMSKEEQAAFDQKWRSLSKFYKDEFFRVMNIFRNRLDPDYRHAPRLYPLLHVPMHTEASIRVLREDLTNALNGVEKEVVVVESKDKFEPLKNPGALDGFWQLTFTQSFPNGGYRKFRIMLLIQQGNKSYVFIESNDSADRKESVRETLTLNSTSNQELLMSGSNPVYATNVTKSIPNYASDQFLFRREANGSIKIFAKDGVNIKDWLPVKIESYEKDAPILRSLR